MDLSVLITVRGKDLIVEGSYYEGQVGRNPDWKDEIGDPELSDESEVQTIHMVGEGKIPPHVEITEMVNSVSDVEMDNYSELKGGGLRKTNTWKEDIEEAFHEAAKEEMVKQHE